MRGSQAGNMGGRRPKLSVVPPTVAANYTVIKFAGRVTF